LSFNYTNLVWDRSPYRAEKLLVLLALADWSDSEGVCFPSYTKIAEKARVSKPGAIGIIQSLIKDGAIEIIEAGNGRGNHHSYRLLPDNWNAKPAPERVKQDEERVNQEEVKGNSPLPFTGEERVKQESIKGKAEREKGKPGTIKGKPGLVPCKEEPPCNHHENRQGEPMGETRLAVVLPVKRTLIDRYHDLFVERFQTKPTISGGKDGKLLKSLSQQFGEERVAELLESFFDSPDQFIKKSGYTIGVFHHVFNRLNIQSTLPSAGIVSDIGRQNAATTQQWLERKYGNG
jgi:hypothetical protein